MVDQFVAVKKLSYKLLGTKTDPYLPAVVLYPPIGVELNAPVPKDGTDETPLKYKDINLVQPVKAFVPIVVQTGKYADSKSVQSAKALVTIVVQDGKSANVKSEHL